jgi:hypothetical protein
MPRLLAERRGQIHRVLTPKADCRPLEQSQAPMASPSHEEPSMSFNPTLPIAAVLAAGLLASCSKPPENNQPPLGDNGTQAAQDANAMASNDVTNGTAMPPINGPASNAPP